MDLRLIGLFAIAMLSATALLILARWPRQRHRSLSMHVADRRGTFLLFALVSTASIALLYAFMTWWFAPALQLPAAFHVVMVAGLASQLAAAWIPCLPGRQEYWHSMAAYLMAILMPAQLLFVLFSPVTAVALKFFTVVALAWMVLMLVLLFAVPSIKRLYLPLQLIYIALFYGIVMVAALTVDY